MEPLLLSHFTATETEAKRGSSCGQDLSDAKAHAFNLWARTFKELPVRWRRKQDIYTQSLDGAASRGGGRGDKNCKTAEGCLVLVATETCVQTNLLEIDQRFWVTLGRGLEQPSLPLIPALEGL